MRQYTVVGFYDSNSQTTVDHVEAWMGESAASNLLEERGEDWRIISVFEGFLKDLTADWT